MTKFHDMVCEKVYPDGSEEYLCPVCERRIILSWPPNYKKVILFPGDESENVVHHAGEAHHIDGGSAYRDPAIRMDRTLEPWNEWMDRTGFGSNL